MEITRRTLLDAGVDDVWRALVDDEERRAWLDDPRPVEVLVAEPGQGLTWRWTEPDEHGVTSTVTIALEETDDGRTALTVTERVAGTAVCSVGEATLDASTWDRRLLGLELHTVVAASGRLCRV